MAMAKMMRMPPIVGVPLFPLHHLVHLGLIESRLVADFLAAKPLDDPGPSSITRAKLRITAAVDWKVTSLNTRRKPRRCASSQA